MFKSDSSGSHIKMNNHPVKRQTGKGSHALERMHGRKES